jgi:hypothetical protein
MMSRFPVLAEFLQIEEDLSLVRCIGDILAWHRVLFRVFAPHELSREDASALTNKDAIQRLPADAQPDAVMVLERYCRAFNESMCVGVFVVGARSSLSLARFLEHLNSPSNMIRTRLLCFFANPLPSSRHTTTTSFTLGEC